MKKTFTLLLAIFITVTLFSQSPQRLSYQAVIRNSSGQIVASKSIGIRISILQASSTGAAVYIETHTTVAYIL
ncbi:MAG: hypothetical protein HZB98_05695 [Bacteroidia bacterium]|nr:hypothetical protein [Bacteroidia bacterium]